jgi:hypothetical protein
MRWMNGTGTYTSKYVAGRYKCDECLVNDWMKKEIHKSMLQSTSTQSLWQVTTRSNVVCVPYGTARKGRTSKRAFSLELVSCLQAQYILDFVYKILNSGGKNLKVAITEDLSISSCVEREVENIYAKTLFYGDVALTINLRLNGQARTRYKD